MEDLVKTISEKAGISEDQAQKALEAVVEYAKEKVPPAFQGMVDGLLKGEKPSGGLGGMLGGFFGK
jgi:nucleoid DNA-binding protein